MKKHKSNGDRNPNPPAPIPPEVAGTPAPQNAVPQAAQQAAPQPPPLTCNMVVEVRDNRITSISVDAIGAYKGKVQCTQIKELCLLIAQQMDRTFQQQALESGANIFKGMTAPDIQQAEAPKPA